MKDIYPVLMLLGATGIYSILAIVALIVVIKKLIEAVKKKKWTVIVLSVLLCSFLSYSVFIREGSVRLLCACYGHPVIAYTFPREKLRIMNHERFFLYDRESIKVNTGKRDFELMPIMPNIEVYRIGPVFISKLQIFNG